jgi:hypothetical protein
MDDREEIGCKLFVGGAFSVIENHEFDLTLSQDPVKEIESESA